ncbi:MAG: protein kinase domain-containing protein [Kofleriaceae bacterium]
MIDDEGEGPEATAIQRKRPSLVPSDDTATPRIERIAHPNERVTNPHERATNPIDRVVTTPVDRVTAPIVREPPPTRADSPVSRTADHADARAATHAASPGADRAPTRAASPVARRTPTRTSEDADRAPPRAASVADREPSRAASTVVDRAPIRRHDAHEARAASPSAERGADVEGAHPRAGAVDDRGLVDRLSPLPLPAPEPTIDSITGERALRQPSSPPAPLLDEPSVSTAAPVRPRPSSTSHHGGSTTIGSPLEALERDELLRTRRFCVIGASIAIAGGFSVPLLPGDPTASALLLSCVGGALASILFLYVRTSDPLAFRRPTTLLGWFIPAACVTSVIPFFGVFSPAAVVLVLGIYFTGLGKSKGLAAAVYIVCAGMQGLLAILVITETVGDTGIIQIVPIAKRDQWIVQGLTQVVLAATYITARISRKTALAAVGELERAVRLAAHREALLLEAREELERALRSGRGRFSDQTIGGYQLGEVIGRGAMGEVYEATAPDGSAVAIKLLSQASLGNLNHVLRFLRELRTAMTLVADNVVRVIEVGESPVPYLVMERLQGKTLAEVLRNQRALPGDQVTDLVRQVGAGITAAAAAGIVHRDLKPQNVFLHLGTTWKVLDFGVARAVDAGDTLTAGHVVGTPSYMAPEQASGSTVDHATDLYALAAIAYRALTGHPPYAAGEIAETLYKVIHTSPRRPSELVEMPSDVDLVLAIGLAKRASDRFSSAADFADALHDAFRGDLPEEIQERGAILVRAGAWAASRFR